MIIICLIGLVILNHSCLMLLNRNISTKKTLTECVIFTIISDILGITALFLKSIITGPEVLIEVMLILPFVFGLIVYSIKKEEITKYKEGKQVRKQIEKKRKKKK